MKLRTALLVAAAIVGMAIACERAAPTAPPPPPSLPPPPPPSSSMVISLATPSADDGAISLTLKGPDIASVQAAQSSYILYSRVANANEMRLIVVGNVAAGPLFTARLSTAHDAAAFTTSVDQVATRADSLRASITGYALSVNPAPQ